MADPARQFTQHHPALLRYLEHFTGDADAAADAAQEAFARLVVQVPPPSPGAARAWLFRVATNVAMESGRTRTRRERLIAGAPERAMGDAPADPHELVESEERRTLARRLLATLPEKERIALLMREEGFTHREIADAVGTTTGSIGTLVARALDRLAARLSASRDTALRKDE
jgi:RNA polymerase sigma factor (sigma-70 family)